MKRTFTLTALLIGTALLGACRPEWRPITVSYPDDPRVLHGTWWIVEVHWRELDVLPAAMELVAGELNEYHDGYQVSGMLLLESGPLSIEGSVDGSRVHRYVEAAGPSRSPPPPARLGFRVLDEELNEVYVLNARADVMDDRRYLGTLWTASEGHEVAVVVTRTAPDAQASTRIEGP